MPANTANRAYTYSVPGDPAQVHAALQELAEDIDADVCAIQESLGGRPAARYRGSGTFASPSPSQPLSPPPSDTFYRVPFDVEEFDTIDCTMQSMEIGNRLIKPEVPGFYFAIATVYVPTLTLAATVTYMGLQIRRGDTLGPTGPATRLVGGSHNVPVDANDLGVRVMSVACGAFMNGVNDAFTVEWRADTTPDVSEYVIGERTLTIMRMSQS